MITLDYKGKYIEYYHYDKCKEFEQHEKEMKNKGWICCSSYDETNENWEVNSAFFDLTEVVELLEQLDKK